MAIPVLVVDSNADSAKRIKESLEAQNLFQVTLATRAIEALMRFTETKFRAAIVDFGLPDLNGADLIRQMRGIDENILVVAILDNGESQPKEIERLAINILMDKSSQVSDLPQKLAQLFKLSTPGPSSLKSIADSTINAKQPLQKARAQKSSVKEEIPQSDAVVIEAPQAATPAQATSADAQAPEAKHSGGAPPMGGDQDLTTKAESGGKVPPQKEPTLEEDAHLQIPEAGPAQRGENQDGTLPIPPWLKEPASVEKYMDSLKQEHSAYATLLSIGNTPWTYSEQLTENQAHGIVRLLSEHDEGLQSKRALIRYIRLSGTGNDFLLYATPVVGDINLSMIFSMDTPFSVARRQTLRLSHMLLEQDPRKASAPQETPVIEKLIAVSQMEDEALLPSEWIPGPKISAPKEEVAAPPPSSPTPESVEEPEAEKAMVSSFAAPPEKVAIPHDWLPKEPRPASHLPFLQQETIQHEKITKFEPINLAQQEPKYSLPFTAILLPRFPNHRLAGSLANQLENWLKDLCIAWGWRVDHIDLRPEFLRFTVSLSPDIAPAQAVQHLANDLSSRILNAFPSLMNDLPSGQFWTKSYLLTAGSDVGKDRLSLFIETTRKEQGLVN